jgi:hypothetical protein
MESKHWRAICLILLIIAAVFLFAKEEHRWIAGALSAVAAALAFL